MFSNGRNSADKMTPLYGLVACGGKSSRMGFDKSLIRYHDIAQRYHTYHLLEPYCEKTFISCNREQAGSILPKYNLIIDAENAQYRGPIAALVTAFEQFPHASFFLIGCDYPFLRPEDIARLIASRRTDETAVCYFNASGFEEPLIAIYENSIQQKLMAEFNNRKYSLRSLLQSVNALHCLPLSDVAIISVDHKRSLDEFKKQNTQH
jgi:molybdopterin-guanine dinucleotide biosynthesis protein A